MEHVEVDKDLFDDLIRLAKESAEEGNCFASLIIKKHNLNGCNKI